MKESAVFFHKNIVLNVFLTFHLAIRGSIHYRTISVTFSHHSIWYFPNTYHMVKEERAEKI